MKNITRKEFEEMTLQELMTKMQDHDYIISFEALKDYAINLINDNNFFLSIHILEALNKCETDFYIYDCCMGTLQDPTPIEDKEDVEHLIDFEEEEE